MLFGTQSPIREIDDKVPEQLVNVASLPGIVATAHNMLDANCRYCFPIGRVGAFDPCVGGTVSSGGVCFDIACRVRT